MSADPRELKAMCVIGAQFVPDAGHLGGSYARNRLQVDPSNSLPQSYFYAAKRSEVSQRLTSIPQGAGGIIPGVNKYIGAPLATFAYGGIAPSTPHPQLNLISGPSKTASFQFEPGVRYSYDPDFSNEASLGGTIGDGTFSPVYNDPAEQRVFPGVAYPVVPSTENAAKYPNAKVNTTYNIWQLKNQNEASLRYMKYVGPIYPSDHQGARMQQVVSGDGSAFLEVDASNVGCYIERVYPIASDLAYGGAQLHYPPSGTAKVQPRDIKAQGGENCGFQIHFRHSAISAVSNPRSPQSTGSIRILWGRPDGPQADSKNIDSFNLILLPGKVPELWFFHPKTQQWEQFPLKGDLFGDRSYEVYIHYCGPNMYIGFSPDAQTWNCFTGLDGDDNDEDYAAFYTPRIPSNAKIGMIFDNVNSSFQYGPAAFNNYHPENVEDGGDLGTYSTSFSVPSKQGEYADAEAINTEFQAGRLRSSDLDDPNDVFEGSPTFYGDWRSTTPELRFEKTNLRTVGDETHLTGRVLFNTTIEGPQFLHIKNTRPALAVGGASGLEASVPQEGSGVTYGRSPKADPSVPLIRPLPWGDITDYLQSWDVSFTLEGETRSLVRGEASVTLVGLMATEVGEKIAYMLEHNILAMTIGAGFGEATPFMDGIVMDAATVGNGENSITTVRIQDVATALLEDTPFSKTLLFAKMRYGRIIEYSIGMAGLTNWYEQQITSDSTKFKRFQKAIDNRLGRMPTDSSLAASILHATPRMKIIETIKPTLELIVNVDALATLYWDIAAKRIRLSWRNEPEYVEGLKFIGAPNADNITFLPNTDITPKDDSDTEVPIDPLLKQAQQTHGVLVGEYSTATSTKQLHSGLIVYGVNYYNRTMQYRKFFPESWSEAAYEGLVGSIGPAATTSNLHKGYVGFRKTLITESKKTSLPDQLSLNIYGRDLEPFLRDTYQSLDFSVYVTKPLKIHGQFYIDTFLGGDEPIPTDMYFYKSVQYSYSAKENYIKADVAGERFPSVIQSGDEPPRLSKGDNN